RTWPCGAGIFTSVAVYGAVPGAPYLLSSGYASAATSRRSNVIPYAVSDAASMQPASSTTTSYLRGPITMVQSCASIGTTVACFGPSLLAATSGTFVISPPAARARSTSCSSELGVRSDQNTSPAAPVHRLDCGSSSTARAVDSIDAT